MKTSPLIVAVILVAACSPSGQGQAQAQTEAAPQQANPHHVVCQEGGKIVVDDYAAPDVPVYTSQSGTDYVSATTSLRIRNTGSCTVVEVPVLPRTWNAVVPGVADGTKPASAR